MEPSNFGTLIVIEPGGTTMRVALNSPYLRIGRSESCDLVLSDPKVSRLHLEMTIVDSKALFECESFVADSSSADKK